MWAKQLTLYITLITLSASSAWAQANDVVKVALIVDKACDLHKSPLVSLLEVKLSWEPGLVLLERVEIEKILEERTLQLAFEAEGAEARRRLVGGGIV